MSGQVKILTFAEGVSVSAPSQSYLLASALVSYADSAAFVTAKGGAAAEGDIFENTTSHKINFYNGTAWIEVDSVKTNFASASAPTVNDDSGDGYSVGSLWITTTGLIYYAVDVSVGSAVWKELVLISDNQTITGQKTFSSVTTISNTTESSSKDTGALIIEGGVGVEKNAYVGGNLVVTGDLTINGTTTTLNTSTLDVEDANINLNKGGNEASADDLAGINIEMSDATHAQIIFDKDIASYFKCGKVGALKEIVDVSSIQTLTNKALSDSTTTIVDVSDPTKKIKFDASGTSGTATTIASSQTTDKTITLPNATTTLVGTDATQTITGKTFDDPMLVKQSSTPASPASSYNKIYPKSDDIWYTLNSSGVELPLGSGGGEYDFLSTKVIADYVSYDDGSASVPVDGAGGSPSTLTIAASPSPISTQAGILNLRLSKSAADGKGEGMAVAFTTRGDVDKAATRVVRINFKSSTNYADSDIGVYCYDVTNSRLLYPADQNVYASSFVSNQQFEFQLSPDSTSYRLIFHVQSTNATAYDLDMIVKFVETKKNYGVMPDRQYDISSYISGLAGWVGRRSTAIPYKTMNGNWRLKLTITGDITSATSGTLTISGLTFKTSTNFYQAITTVANSGSMGGWAATIAGTGQITFQYGSSYSSVFISGDVELDSKPTWAIDNYPVVLGEDAGLINICAKMYLGSASNHTSSGNYQKCVLDTVSYDYALGWDSVNKYWVVPETGNYDISAVCTFSSIADTQVIIATIYVNGSMIASGSAAAVGAAVTSAAKSLVSVAGHPLIKGQYVEMYAYQSDSASEAYVTGATNTFMYIAKRSSPQQIAASEQVVAQYYPSTNQSTSGDTVIDFDTKIKDTHNAVSGTGTAWKFTAPISGFYNVSVFIAASSRSWIAGQTAQITIKKNGSFNRNLFLKSFDAAITSGVWLSGSGVVYLSKGEYLSASFNGDGNPTLSGGSDRQIDIFLIK